MLPHGDLRLSLGGYRVELMFTIPGDKANFQVVDTGVIPNNKVRTDHEVRLATLRLVG